MTSILKRFLEYVKIDTQADPFSKTYPSTEKQKDLSKLLVKELKEYKLDAILDDYGYVYAKIASNINHEVSPIGFIAHVDTSFDAPGANVNPKVIKEYDGSLIILNDDLSMDQNTHPALSCVIGDDIVVTDGNTLLGADDKCGVAIIMELARYCYENPSFKHGDIYLCFTPDEEIGKGTDHFDFSKFKAKFAYTLDGSQVGGIEYENFNAASAVVTFTGRSIHPGTAKGKMVNSQLLAMQFHDMIPAFDNPAFTEGYEGFYHLTNISGTVEQTKAMYIIRDHDKNLFEQKKQTFKDIATYLNKHYKYEAVEVKLVDSYYNMADILASDLGVVNLAIQAIQALDLEPIIMPIRGGTDGARLTYMGLPCPNLGTGGFNFHSRFEFASVNQMIKALEVVINIVRIHTQNK